MQHLVLDVLQDDCPLTRATREHDVAFTTPYWRFETDPGRWDLRVHADGADGEALEAGLETLRDDEAMRRFDLRRKTGSSAFVRLLFDETAAIGTVSNHDGYVVAPFYNVDGRERWSLGFDTDADADETLSELDRHEEFTVRDRHRVDTSAAPDPFRHYEAAETLLDSCRELTRREHDTLETAMGMGYYATPRGTTLAAIGDEIGVSDVAVSKTLRRAERKLLASSLEASRTVRSE